MSLNQLRKTRWTINADGVTVRPFGLFYIMSVVFAIAFAGLSYYLFVSVGPMAVMPVLPVFAGIVIIFALLGGNAIIFDNQQQVMRKKLFGFLPVSSMPFEKIEGINVVTTMGGGYNYRVFKKSHKYGKGMVISCGYSKNNDANAIAFTEEVVPLVHAYLDKAQPLVETKKTITAYRFFSVTPPEYRVKKNKTFQLIMGIVLLAIAFNEIFNTTFLADSETYVKYLVIAGCQLGGIALVTVAFTKIVFDTSERAIYVVSPIGLGNKKHAFDDFERFQIVRRTTNAIYSGTDVQMHFKNNKILVVRQFNSSRRIEQFLDEVRSIMEK